MGQPIFLHLTFFWLLHETFDFLPALIFEFHFSVIILHYLGIRYSFLFLLLFLLIKSIIIFHSLLFSSYLYPYLKVQIILNLQCYFVAQSEFMVFKPIVQAARSPSIIPHSYSACVILIMSRVLFRCIHVNHIRVFLLR